MVAGRGPYVAVEEATGWAVRYEGWDTEADAPRELPEEQRVPVTLDTPFDLASLTKLFTTVAAVQQMERGTLGIDARVAAYVPELTAADDAGLTLRHLLTHTSGLRPELPLYELPDAAARLDALRHEKPLVAPAARPATPTSTSSSSSSSWNASPAGAWTASSTTASPARSA